MFALNLVLLALLALSTGQLGIPRYVQGQWIIEDENPIYEDPDQQAVKAILPESPLEVVEPVTENHLLTTVEMHVIKEKDSDEGEEESAVWKIVLVAVVLLVSAVGSVSMAYYMCVWRGDRIHYQPQKQSSA